MKTQDDVLDLIFKKDGKVYQLLYDMYSKSLFVVIINLVKYREESEDVLQDVFVKIWKNIDSYVEEKGRFYALMLNIVRNTVIYKLRSRNFKNSKKQIIG